MYDRFNPAILALAALTCTASGCVADAEHGLTDEERLLLVAEQEGFDVDNAVYDGEYLIVDDVLFGPEHLHDVVLDDELRGYFWGEPVARARRDICLVLDDEGADIPDVSWFWAFALATYEWNASPNSDIDVRFKYLSDPDEDWCEGRDIINVREGDVGTNLAQATFPSGSGSNRRPGNLIRVARGSTASNKTAMHEIGHCFGFTHPDDPAGARIAGTAAASSNYPSVMWQNGDGPAGNDDLTALTEDDIESIEARYGTRRTFTPLPLPSLPGTQTVQP